LTDAHVVAGSLGPETALGGRLRLDVEAARASIERVAARLGLGIDETAEGIIALATAHLEGALQRISSERGEDPREYTLVAFGGAGPLHAGRLVRDMGFPAAIIPIQPGLFSAAGLIAADLRVDDALTVLRLLAEDAMNDLADWFTRTADELRAQLGRDGIPPSAIHLAASIDCRYLGQGYELNVPIESIDHLEANILRSRFHDRHRATYGHVSMNDPVEAVTLRISAFGRWRDDPVSELPGSVLAITDIPADAIIGRRDVSFRDSAAPVTTPVLWRPSLGRGTRLTGPVIIEQADSTTLVLPGQVASIDHLGSLWIVEEEDGDHGA
jgi:N-methylhydantoinase A